jgi:hypothetical protein
MRLRRWGCALLLASACAPAFAGMPVAAPRVVAVQPSAPQVPANLLRISIGFAAPIDGEILSRLGLLRNGGEPVSAPFLQQELWSPDGRILTILLHPGRVKSGLLAREQLGAILEQGDSLMLTLDGQPIQRWQVGAALARGPDTSAWQLSSVRAATRQALVVTLDGPIDGRDADYLAVLDAHGRPLPGHASLQDGEHRWVFIPQRPWHAGRYRLAVSGNLEDPAGNRLGSQFETPLNSTSGPAQDATLLFSVASREP